MKTELKISTLLIISLIISSCVKNQTPVDPGRAKVWFKKGVAFYKVKKYETAIECFDNATKLNPKSYMSWYFKGRALFDSGEDKATIERKGGFTNSSYDVGRFKEALKAFNKAIEIKPDFAEAWGSKASVLIGLGKYGDALKATNRAIKLNPKDDNAWWNKAVALQRMGRYRESTRAVDRALKLNPSRAKLFDVQKTTP